jgi:hypothetical protein
MHHTFYATGLTSCGRRIAGAPGNKPSRSNTLPVTGLDSLVTCQACLDELVVYRTRFPQASNCTRKVQVGDNLVDLPVMEGGAR